MSIDIPNMNTFSHALHEPISVDNKATLEKESALPKPYIGRDHAHTASTSKLLQKIACQNCYAPPSQDNSPAVPFNGPPSITVINEDGTIGHGDPADYPDLFPGGKPSDGVECFAGPPSVTVINEDGTIGHGDPADYPDIFC